MKTKSTHRWKRAAALLLVLTLLSALAGTAFAEEEALNDGSPWVDYVLHENVERQGRRVRKTTSTSMPILTGPKTPRFVPATRRSLLSAMSLTRSVICA